MADRNKNFDFSLLVTAIQNTHESMASQAVKAINMSHTMRNWLIGCYIMEYEQNGADRADYGKNLLTYLSKNLESKGITGCAPRSLRLYRKFYLNYPQIWQTLSAESQSNLLPEPIWQTLSAKLEIGNSGVLLSFLEEKIREFGDGE